MKISVVIPAYNAAATIDATIKSVLAQTLAPDEILVVDDGSTDDMFLRLQAYQPKISVFQQSNHGVAHARNFLCGRAAGELIAFLDADDIWHPQYLDTQHAVAISCPEAVASFTGHVNFRGYGDYPWDEHRPDPVPDFELVEPEHFFKRYNLCSGPFGSMSFCCIPKRVLEKIGPEPFPVKLSGADDFFLMNILPLYGPIIYTRTPLVAYRETPGSISSNQLKSVERTVNTFEFLAEGYKSLQEGKYAKAFKTAFASKRRQYAKFLMGVKKTAEARSQLRSSLANAGDISSVAKSLGLLLSTHMPGALQPRWPGPDRK
jgi:glycosyltransferase involved in cell wall biosynthesis